jgi:hypothetical protein
MLCKARHFPHNSGWTGTQTLTGRGFDGGEEGEIEIAQAGGEEYCAEASDGEEGGAEESRSACGVGA